MLSEIDPAQKAKLNVAGIDASGIIERIVVAALSGLARLAAPIIALAASVFDAFLAGLSEFFFDAQGQRNEGFYTLCAALMKDLTGIEVDGAKLFADFQTNGRLSAMVDLGGGLINAFASEFVGQKQNVGPGGFTITPGDGVGGLPTAQLTPAGGVDAARALMGFMTSFAIREGNTDIFADFLPYGLGRFFKDFAEDFSKNIGIGRLARVGFSPLFKTLVGDPLQWALNIQYRPTLLSAQQAVRAWVTDRYTTDQFRTEMQMHGYSDARIDILAAQKEKSLGLKDIQLLRALGKFDDQDVMEHLKALGYDQFDAANIVVVWDNELFRQASLNAAHHFVAQFVAGDMSGDDLKAALNAGTSGQTGTLLLTQPEIDAITGLANELKAFPRRRITGTQMVTAMEEGLVTIQDYEAYLTERGYPQDDVNILGLLALIAAKDKASKAAKAAAPKTPTATPPATPAPPTTPSA
jgi:hypothetical protein